MTRKQAQAIIEFHRTTCTQDIHSMQTVKRLSKALAIIDGQPKMKLWEYFKPCQGECFCGYKQIPSPPHIAGLQMAIHYNYVHIYKGK